MIITSSSQMEKYINFNGLSFKNLLHLSAFRPRTSLFASKVACEKHKLVIYGDSYAERGTGGNLHTFNNKYVHHSLITFNNEKDLYYGGYSLDQLEKFDVRKKDLIPYIPMKEDVF